ncbi:MAG: PKD domain-containing protein [Bacteroidota bacterium]
MKSNLFGLMAVFLFLGTSLFAQTPCTDFPSPVIVPDFLSNCQEGKPRQGEPTFAPEPEPGEEREECLLVCENSTVTYTVAEFDATHTYIWEAFGNYTSTSPGAGQFFPVTWGAAPSTGLVQVTEISAPGCTTTVSICVEIIPSPVADFISYPPAVGGVITVCDGTEVFFEDQSSDDVITWIWDFGDGSPVSNDEDPSHVYTYDSSNPSYTGTLTVVNDCGCTSVRNFEVVVEPSQAPVISCVSTVCENEEVKYTVTNASDCTGASFNWTAVGGSITNVMDNMVWVRWDSPVNGQGTLTVEIVGCPDVCTIPTTVVVPILTASLTLEGPTVVCVGDLIEVQIPPQPGSIYTWSGTASFFATTGQNDHSIELDMNSPGNYTICVSINPQSVVATDRNPRCDINYANPYCLPITVQPEFEVSFDQTACEDDFVSFSANGGTAGWEAIDGNGTSIPLPGSSFTVSSYLTPGFYEIRATTNSPSLFCNAFGSAFLTVLESAPALAPTALVGKDPICPGSTYDYSITPDPGYYATWATSDGTILGSGNNVAITWNSAVPASGVYEVTVTQEAMSGLSCPSSQTFQIGVVTAPTLTIVGATDVCTDAETTYTVTGLNPDVTFLEWVIPPTQEHLASIVGGVNDPTVTIQFNNTLGAVDLTLNYTVCNQVDDVDLTVNIVALPNLNLTIPVDGCMNTNIPMSGQLTPAPGGTVNWDWDFDDGFSDINTGGSTYSTSNAYNMPGTKVVEVTATFSGAVCSGSVTNSGLINIKPAPLVNITTTNGNNLCPPTTQTELVASITPFPGSSGSYSYNWSGPNPGTGPTLPVDITQIGTYTLEVVDNIIGCSATATIEVESDCDPNPTCTGVDFTPPTNGCGPYNFNASLTGAYIFNPTWDFGDGNGATGTSVTHTYDDSGYYYVRLSAFDANGDRCSVVKQVIVLHVPDFIAEYTCPGNSIEVQLLNQTDFIDPATPLSFNWTFPGGSSTLENPVVGGLPSGLNNVSLVVTGGGATCTITDAIDVPTPVVAGFTANDPVCEGNPMTFTNITTGDAISWDWDFGDGAGSNLEDAERTYSFATTMGMSNVTLTVTDAWGCTSVEGFGVLIDENVLTGNVSINSPSNPYCPSANPTLTAAITASPSGPTYQWGSNDNTTFPLGSLGTGNPSNVIPTTGEYVVVVEDALGCRERSAAAEVIISPDPVPFIIGQDEYCVNEPSAADPITLNLSANQGSGYSYLWSITPPINGVGSFSGPDLTFNVGTVPGTHSITVELTDLGTNCSAISAPFTVTLNELPQGLFIDPAVGCVPVLLEAMVSGPAGVSYLWSDGTAGNQTTALGGGTIEVTAYTPEGCQATASAEIGEGPDLSDVAVGCYCFPEPVTWTAPQGNYQYAWFSASGGGSLSNSMTYTITQSGEYFVVVTGPNGCSSTSDPIIVDIGDVCARCRFKAELVNLECIGIDAITGGSIYSFSASFTNFFISLNGITGTSPQAIVNIPPPATLPGSGATTVLSGTITLLPGNTSAVITFSGAGANGLACETKIEIGNFPDCGGGSDPCNITTKVPDIECFNTVDGFTYYTFSMPIINGTSNTYIDMEWYNTSCGSGDPDVNVSLSTNTLLPGTTVVNGFIRVPKGMTSECFKFCAIDKVTGEVCCWERTFELPKCNESQEPCRAMKDLGSKILCATPPINGFGHAVYTFDINVSSHVAGTAFINTGFGQGNLNISGVNVSATGTVYNITGTLTIVPPFSGNTVCFWVQTFDGQEICWTRICLKLPSCEPEVCDIDWGLINLTCENETEDYAYYSYQIAATNNSSTLYTNLSWYACDPDADVTLNTSVGQIAPIASTLIQGTIRVRRGSPSECVRFCVFDTSTETECCEEITFKFPECNQAQEPCRDVNVEAAEVTCCSPSVDPFGNRCYELSLEVNSHIGGGTAMLLAWPPPSSNNIIMNSVNVSGNAYSINATILDVPPFEGDRTLCFRILTMGGGEICWTTHCVRIPSCEAGIADGNDIPELSELRSRAFDASLEENQLQVMPNPATDYLQVEFDINTTERVELRMIGVDGQLVRHITNMDARTSFPMEVGDLPTGLYLIAVMQDGKMIAQEKVAIIR